MNPTQPIIDYYDNAEAWRPAGEATLPDLIDAIRSDEFAARVAEVRAMIASGNKDGANAKKKELPAVSLSGSVVGRRARAVKEGRFIHSGFLQIDLDVKDNPGLSIADMRATLTADPRMAAVFVSPSGEGVKGVARCTPDPESHLGAFLAAEKHFASLGLTIDKSCKDPVRLCFISHDPDACLLTGTDRFEPLPVDPMDFEVVPNDEPEAITKQASRSVRVCSSTGAIIISGTTTLPPFTADSIADMLRHIPYPGYDEWLKITNAVWREIGVEEGTPVLQAWAPEKNPGDYAHHAQHPLQDVTIATVVWHAKEHGWRPPQPASAAITRQSTSLATAPRQDPEMTACAPAESMTYDGKTIPANIFPVPNGNIGNDLASRHIFAIIGQSRRLFMRGGQVHEVGTSTAEAVARLDPLRADRFSSLIETFGAKVMILENRGKDNGTQWRSTTMGENHCRMLLTSEGAREFLPPIRQMPSAPVLVPDGTNGSSTLGHGWHPHNGGTFVIGKSDLPEMIFESALPIFLTLLDGFNFTTTSDISRAAASFLSPALKIGGWINDDFPIDVAEADQSQAGKSYRHKLIAAIYGETASQITNTTGGVGSLDERVAGALIAGRPIITLENVRGRIDSQTLESAIRGVGRVTARSFRACVEVDTSPFLWQMSTNGAELTRDLANRAVITRIRKQEDGFVHTVYQEGPLLAHVQANQPRFLAAVHSIIREWARHGCPRTNENRHDFSGWCQALDWIVQNILGLPPLLDGHREEQLRTANPKLQWLRDVINAIITSGHDTQYALSAGDIADAAEENDIPIPGRRNNVTNKPEQDVGRIMSQLYRDAGEETITVDGRRLTRHVRSEYNQVRKENMERKVYLIDTN